MTEQETVDKVTRRLLFQVGTRVRVNKAFGERHPDRIKHVGREGVILGDDKRARMFNVDGMGLWSYWWLELA